MRALAHVKTDRGQGRVEAALRKAPRLRCRLSERLAYEGLQLLWWPNAWRPKRVENGYALLRGIPKMISPSVLSCASVAHMDD